jgi:hypothetical protein
VLNAVKEVKDALTDYEKEKLRREILEEAVALLQGFKGICFAQGHDPNFHSAKLMFIVFTYCCIFTTIGC